jgi:transposase-like protein
VLNKLPKSLQAKAKAKLHQIWQAPDKAEAQRHFDDFIRVYGAKYPKAAECLKKDHEVLLTFYDFPAEHWADLLRFSGGTLETHSHHQSDRIHFCDRTVADKQGSRLFFSTDRYYNGF